MSLIKRVAWAVIFVPVILAAVSLLGLLFAAIGTVIRLALRDETEIKSLAFRLLVFFSIVVISLLGTVRVLNWVLGFAEGLARRWPALRRVASDSLLGLVGFAGVVGLTFLALGALSLVPNQRMPLLVCEGILTAASAWILLPRLRPAKNRSPSPNGQPPSGAVSARVPRSPESTAAQASRAVSGGVA